MPAKFAKFANGQKNSSGFREGGERSKVTDDSKGFQSTRIGLFCRGAHRNACWQIRRSQKPSLSDREHLDRRTSSPNGSGSHHPYAECPDCASLLSFRPF